MTITELPLQHVAAAVDLWRACGLTRPWNDPDDDLQRALRGPNSTVLAYLRDSSLVGTAMVGHDGHRGWVYYLAVAADERRGGIGRDLMRACEMWISARRIPKLQLMIRTDNAVVLAFYGRLGYEINDVVVLGRRLDG